MYAMNSCVVVTGTVWLTVSARPVNATLVIGA
jgi:hypothetical protein